MNDPFAKYDEWKTAYPEEWDIEVEYSGSLFDYEFEVADGDDLICAICDVEVNKDKIEEIKVKYIEVIGWTEDDLELEYCPIGKHREEIVSKHLNSDKLHDKVFEALEESY